MEAEWVAALPRLRQRVGERNFTTWIEPLQCSRDANGLRLEVGSRFFQEWIACQFLTCIREVLQEISGTTAEVRVVVAPQVVASRVAADAPPRETLGGVQRKPTPRTPKIGHLIADYTFERFVVGAANEGAYEAARVVTTLPGRRFNPFFVWGGVGLGKTHLVNALAHELLVRSRRRMACLSAEAFMNTLITSLRQDRMTAFRERFRELDVLILDDVQFLAGKERTQEEFFHTFNALYATGKQIVLTSDKPPDAIAEIEHRLRSRFAGGLIVDIHPPTPEMRVTIVLKKAALQGVALTEEVARSIAHRSGPSVRELEGALTRVIASAMLQRAGLDVSMVQRILAPVTPPVVVVSVEAVQETVSQHFRLSIADLKSPSRTRSVTFPRQIAMYLSRVVADASFPSIAEKFGGRDHSTVIHAVRAVEEKRNANPEIATMLSVLENELRSGARA